MAKVTGMILFLLLTTFDVKSQESRIVKTFHKESLEKWADNNSDEYLGKKELVKEYEAVSLVALSYYPELKDVAIRFRMKNIKTTLMTKPRADFIFKKKKRRIYNISVDNNVRNNKGILLKDVPLNAQIGIIGHELAHIIDYESKSATELIITGIRYLGPRYRRRLEGLTDEEAISRGLGWQLMDWTKYVYNSSNASKKYLNYKKKFYNNTAELNLMLREKQY